VLELSGNDVFIKTETSRHEEFLFKTDKFLEDNEEYEKTAVRRRIEEFTEDRPVAKAIFQSIKNSFKI
jgi:hypothetical protein